MPESVTTKREIITIGSPALYLAAYGISLCGLGVAREAVKNNTLILVTLFITTIGFLISFYMRRQARKVRYLDAPILILCAALCSIAVFGNRILPGQFMYLQMIDHLRLLAGLMAMMAAFRSFTLGTDQSLIFCCVPTLAIFGLAGVLPYAENLLLYFFIYVCCSVFLLIHESGLRAGIHTGKPVMVQAQSTAMCVAFACILGSIIAPTLRQIGSHYLLPPGVYYSLQHMNERFEIKVNPIDDNSTLTVGTGPVEAGDQLIMRVTSPEPSYWRGVTYDHYTGHGWENSYSRSTSLVSSLHQVNRIHKTYLFQRSAIDGGVVYSRTLNQTFQIFNNYTRILYASGEPQKCKLSTYYLIQDMAGVVHIPPPGLHDDSYDVTSEKPETSQQVLSQAKGEIPQGISKTYLSLSAMDPLALVNMRNTAKSLTRGLNNNYEKVKSLEAWVGLQCKYNLNAPPLPRTEDAASYFLYVQKEGYCDSFATSLTVLCRSIGIPARLATGFIAGEAIAGDFIVRDKDRHAWTEVYFPGVGWSPFDSTSYAIDTSSSSIYNKKHGLIGLLANREAVTAVVLFLVIGLTGYVFKVEFIDRNRPKNIVISRTPMSESNRAILMDYNQACKILGRYIRTRSQTETPDEYLQLIMERLYGPALHTAEEFANLTDIVIKARYAGEPSLYADRMRARQALNTIKRSRSIIARCARSVNSAP